MFVAPRSGPVYSNSTVTVIFFGTSAGIWDFIRYRLVMRGFSAFGLYTKVPFVSLVSVSSTCLLILLLLVGWLISATMLLGVGQGLLVEKLRGHGVGTALD